MLQNCYIFRNCYDLLNKKREHAIIDYKILEIFQLVPLFMFSEKMGKINFIHFLESHLFLAKAPLAGEI